MYQVFYSSESEGLKPGPRFRLLKDALAHVDRDEERSYAIRAPDGTWHRDANSGRAIFGRGGRVERPFEDEDTQPFGIGSGTHPTRRKPGN